MNILKIKEIFKTNLSRNKKVVENYFFMTILQVLNSFFYLLIYPYLIRTLGATSYGSFVFATSVANYLGFLMNFGFDFPSTKRIAENVGNPSSLEDTLSKVFSAKLLMFALCSIVFIILTILFPVFNSSFFLFLFCFLSLLSNIFFPQWYFQGIQNMKVVTYLQFGVKLISLPFIFLFVNDHDDIEIYAAIVSLFTILGSIIAFFIIVRIHKLKVKLVKFTNLKSSFKEGFPFFLSNSLGTIKEQSITIFIGFFFGMKDVAVYDLANKIILIPRMLVTSVNAAIFPKMVKDFNVKVIKRIVNIEFLLSIFIIGAIIVFGRFIIHLVGGDSMQDAYYVSIFLSFTILNWLVVGAYANFIFIPKNKFYFITKNQILATISFIVFSVAGIFIYKNIIVFGCALAASGITEILYCKYLINKYKLLTT